MRKDVEKYILSVIGSLDSSGFNTKLYEEMFKGMNNGEFDKFKLSLRTGENILQLIETDATEISITALTDIAKKFKIPLYQRITSPMPNGIGMHTGTIERKVLDTIVRRVSQDAAKGVHVAKGNKKVNPITGQSSGESKGTNLTLPEMKILDGKGADKVLEEFLSYKSGDLGAKTAAEAYIEKYGTVKLANLQQYKTISGSTKMIKNYFQGAHISFKTVPVK